LGNKKSKLSAGKGFITQDLMLRSTKRMRLKNDDDVTYLGKITHLHMADKKINTLSGDCLKMCKNLRVLYLDDNSIKKMECLQFQRLTHLYLQNNDIEEIQCLEHTKALSKLYLNGNKINSFKGLEHAKELTELHTSDQTLPPGNRNHTHPHIDIQC